MAICLHSCQGGAKSAAWVYLDEGGFVPGGLCGYSRSGIHHQVWTGVNAVGEEAADEDI